MPDTDWREYFKAFRARYEAAHQTHDDGPTFIVTVPGHEVFSTDLPSTPNKVLKWVSQNKGWVVKAQHSQTHHQPELFAADSKTSGARKGDIKTPERDKEHWGVQGVLAEEGHQLANFWASWETVDGKTKFTGVVFWDFVTEERVPENQTGPFEDWLRILAPIGAPKKRAPRKTIQLLDMEEWHA